MCIVSYFPQSIDINIESLNNGADFNNDGHGWAVASAEHGIERGGSMKFEEALDSVIDARTRHGSRSAVIFHSRYATHGEFGEFNIHPFWVGENQDTIMAHNGVLPKEFHPDKDDRRSDTRIFVDRVAPYFSRSGNPSRRQGGQLAQIIGSGNKLVFMSVATGKPKVRIVNQAAGIWDGGAWYSNDGYLPSRFNWRDYAKTSVGGGGLWNTDVEDGWERGDDGTWSYVGNRESWTRYVTDDATGYCMDVETGQFVCWTCDGLLDTAGYCTECSTCQECFDPEADCVCYVPPSLTRARALVSVEV